MSEVEMGQVPVKWVYETFDEKPPAIPVNGSYVVSAPLDHDILPHAVVPLEALREVVEGLREIEHLATFTNQGIPDIVRRLLAQLGDG